jgi:hypothetical protein
MSSSQYFFSQPSLTSSLKDDLAFNIQVGIQILETDFFRWEDICFFIKNKRMTYWAQTDCIKDIFHCFNVNFQHYTETKALLLEDPDISFSIYALTELQEKVKLDMVILLKTILLDRLRAHVIRWKKDYEMLTGSDAILELTVTACKINF